MTKCLFQCGPAARQRILSAAGALVKRASAAHAEKLAAAWRSTKVDEDVIHTTSLGSRILTTPPDDPGPACWLLIKLIEHIEELIQPLTQSDLSGINNDQVCGFQIIWFVFMKFVFLYDFS